MNIQMRVMRFVVFFGLLLVALPSPAKVQGGPGTPILFLTPPSSTAGWTISLFGGPGGAGQVTFDGVVNGSVMVDPLLKACFVSPMPSDTLAWTPPGYHVISADSADAVFLTSTPSTSGSPSFGLLGQTISVVGLPFAPNSAYTLTFVTPAGTTPITGTTTAAGLVSASKYFNYYQLSGSSYVVWYITDAYGNTAYGTTALAILPAPTLNLSVLSGPAGLTITLSGSGYTPNKGITLYFSGTKFPTGAIADAQGNFSTTETIPSGYDIGQYVVDAVSSGSGGENAWTTFTITAPTISITAANPPPPWPVGSNPQLPVTVPAIVTGSGWVPGENVNVQGIGNFIADAYGSINPPKSTVNAYVTITGLGSFINTATDTNGNEAMTLFWAGILGPCD
jgi:hypothetical protein